MRQRQKNFRLDLPYQLMCFLLNLHQEKNNTKASQQWITGIPRKDHFETQLHNLQHFIKMVGSTEMTD